MKTKSEVLNAIEAITAQINAVKQSAEQIADASAFTFTQEQMIAFVRHLEDEFLESLDNQIERMDFSGIEINIEEEYSSRGNSYSFHASINEDELRHHISSEAQLGGSEDDEILDTVNNIYKKVTSTQQA